MRCCRWSSCVLSTRHNVCPSCTLYYGYILRRQGCVRENSGCTRCFRDHGDLIHLLWHCPKLHLYWTGVIATINKLFQVNISNDPKLCISGILDGLPIEDNPKQAIPQALFQVRILRGWKATEPPILKEWINQMGVTLHLEKYIFQHRGQPDKFEAVWSSLLNTPGLSLVDLILDRLQYFFKFPHQYSVGGFDCTRSIVKL